MQRFSLRRDSATFLSTRSTCPMWVAYISMSKRHSTGIRWQAVRSHLHDKRVCVVLARNLHTVRMTHTWAHCTGHLLHRLWTKVLQTYCLSMLVPVCWSKRVCVACARSEWVSKQVCVVCVQGLRECVCVRNECVREYLQPARPHQFLEVNTVPASRQVLCVLESVFLVRPTAWSRIVRWFVGVYWADAKNASVVVQVHGRLRVCKLANVFHDSHSDKTLGN